NKKMLSFPVILMTSCCLFAQTIPVTLNERNQNNRIESGSNINEYSNDNIDCTQGLNNDFVAPSLIDIEVTEIDDVGNDSNGKTSSEKNFIIGKNKVTAHEYCSFLNAVAASDPYELGKRLKTGGANLEKTEIEEKNFIILRSGSPGSYSYSVIDGRGESPVSNVSWLDAARFCNWLDNGQPVGEEGIGTTETGAYTLNGKLDGDLNSETHSLVHVNPGAKFFLSNDIQWGEAINNQSSSMEYGNSGFSVVSALIVPTPCMFSRTAARAVVVGGSALLPSLFERSSIESIETGKIAEFSREYWRSNSKGEEIGKISTFNLSNIGARGLQFGSIAFADSSRDEDSVKATKEVESTGSNAVINVLNGTLFSWKSWFNSYRDPYSSANIKKLEEMASLAYDKANRSEGEEAVRLWEKAIKAVRAYGEVIDKVIESEKAALTKASDEETKKQWGKKLQQSQNIKLSIASSILSMEVNKASEAAFIAQNKAGKAKGEEAVRLWEEAIQAVKAHGKIIDKVIESEKAVLAKASDKGTKKQWGENLQQSQNIKLSIASSIISMEANKASEAVSVAQSKANNAKGEEAIRLWEEAIQAVKVHGEVMDKVIESEKTALEKAFDEETKNQWKEQLQQSQKMKVPIESSILEMEADKASAAISMAQDNVIKTKGK
ncbi:MAG TPA: SUMF1/EgtB/PvdO family nonheme iron enzyme, partial [Chthoniobacterales bacterium]|nr:SUMF1/EgtB/PvdO family nonheme iron enzyme [Chthoniobacterales bacterium]